MNTEPLQLKWYLKYADKRIGKAIGLTCWVGYCCVTFGGERLLAGPLWLVGRGPEPTAIATLLVLVFGACGIFSVFNDSRTATAVNILLIPVWVLVGAWVGGIADW